MPKKTQKQLPELVVFLACDAAARDPNTKKATIYGIFDRLLPSDFPADVQFTVYSRLRGGAGNHDVTLDLVDKNGKAIGENSPTFQLECSPSMVAELVVVIGGISIPSPGAYRLQLRAGTKILGQYQLTAEKRKEKSAK